MGKFSKKIGNKKLQSFISEYEKFRVLLKANAVLHYQTTGDWPEYLIKSKSIQGDESECKKIKIAVQAFTKPTVKFHILLNHLEDYLVDEKCSSQLIFDI